MREDLGAGAAGLGAFAAEVRCNDFDGAAHLEEARAHAATDSFFEGIFAGWHDEFSAGEASGFAFLSRIVVVVRCDDGGAALVIASVENDADDVADPIGRLAGTEIIEDENFDGTDGLENAHFRGFAGGIVAGLDFLQEFAVIAEEAGVTATNEIFQGGDGEMSLANSRRAHEEEAFFGSTRIIANESLREHLRIF